MSEFWQDRLLRDILQQMHPEVARRFEDLEKRRLAFTKKVEALPKEKQDAKPRPGEFSPAEVVMHLAITEHGNVVFLKKTAPALLAGKKPKITFLYKRTVSKMQDPSSPVPTLPFMIPKGPVDLDQAIAAWAGARAEIEKFLEEAKTPSEAFIKFNFVFGTASASQFLDLLEAHMNYHEKRFPA
jgi:hypothetical protein